MAMRRTYRRRSFAPRRPQRTYEWTSFLVSQTVAANTVVSNLTPLAGLESAFGADLLGWRLHRCLISGHVGLTAGSAAEVDPAATWQAYVYLDTITHTSFFADVWPSGAFWNQRGSLYAASALTTGNSPAGTGVWPINVDLRLNRKFRDITQSVKMFIGNATAADDEVYFGLCLNFLLSRPS